MAPVLDDQGITLPPGFHHDPVDGPADPPPLGVLDYFKGTFVGIGFNTIFRPNMHPGPAPPAPPNPSVLELNLTTETIAFSDQLKAVANRGLDPQPDTFLNAIAYLQTVDDVANTKTGGRDDPDPRGIHSETGFWMNVPASTINPQLGTTLARLGSIPHGTTINAQGTVISTKPGAPDISPRPITPFTIGNPSDLKRKDSQTASNPNTPRLPQDLSLFIKQGTITQDILDNPVVILTNINKQINITETITFSVATNPAAPEFGGGTANIAFLLGSPPIGPNASAVAMNSTFWVEMVHATLSIPPFSTDDGTPLLLQPDFNPSNDGLPAPPLPTFSVTPPGPIASLTVIDVSYVQIQYAQVVFLNFHSLTWPHVSVATLVPAAPIPVPASAFEGSGFGKSFVTSL
jgi:hypothetical protein